MGRWTAPEGSICALGGGGLSGSLCARIRREIGTLYTNDNKAELTIVVTVAKCRLAHKYARMQTSAIRHERVG